ncbi:MAG TPA: hypothetical protein VJ729_05500 [Nitrososphaeraceae archaeon]|nr:hypothetical protein [Nitrososphaeraceae archaeon]
MTRGLGERQRKDKLLTTSKIASYLAIRPYTYQDLQRESKIHRQRLRHGLDELLMRKLVIRHKFSRKDPNLERNAIYYLLNWSKTESKQLVDHYYSNRTTENINDAILRDKDKDKATEEYFEKMDFLPNALQDEELKSLSDKELRQTASSMALQARKIDLIAAKRQLKLNDPELSELSMRITLKAANYYISRIGYSFLDFLVKLSADEKIEGVGIDNYRKLWEITEKTGLLDKHISEIH